MSWFQSLVETYDCAESSMSMFERLNSEHLLAPFYHAEKKANIEITITLDGDFIEAKVVNEKTLIPMTLESENSRASTKIVPHGMSDSLKYCAGDLNKYTSINNQNNFDKFIENLRCWCVSEFGNPKTNAIYKYLSKKRIVTDLVKHAIFPVDSDNQITINVEQVTSLNMKDNYEVLKFLGKEKGDYSVEKILIRWKVYGGVNGDNDFNVWQDESVINSWISYFNNVIEKDTRTKLSLCVELGRKAKIAEFHPKYIVNAGDNSKIISANDSDGFTYRGKFIEKDQCASISIEATHKAHSALRWLIARQAYKNDTQVFVAWAKSGNTVPNPLTDSATLFGLEPIESEYEKEIVGDLGQTYSVLLAKNIAGYSTNLIDDQFIYIIGLDSATPGRMAVSYYREISNSDFIKRLNNWHLQFAWIATRFVDNPNAKNKKSKILVITSPAPDLIAKVAYGKRLDKALKKSTISRILPCVVDGVSLPIDLLNSSFQKAVKPLSFENWFEWEEALFICCALYRGYNIRQFSKEYSMTLETTRNTRDYLYGRLLAYAEHIEEKALYIAGEKRDTTAIKLFQRFADRPYTTWLIIEKSLVPYWSRLKARWPGFVDRLKSELDTIHALFVTDEFVKDLKLSPEFLLGYHCQRYSLRDFDSSKKIESEVVQD